MIRGSIKIRNLKFEEIPDLSYFPPQEWQLDLPKFLYKYFGNSWFYPIVAIRDDKIVGVGNGIRNNQVGWLGNIIVLPQYQNQGIGTALTKNIIDYFWKEKCRTLVLIATEQGKNLYKNFGFYESSQYIFFKKSKILNFKKPTNIKRISNDDLDEILKLDKEISAESRPHLLNGFIQNGWLFHDMSSEKIRGYFLPDFESGPIIVRDSEAGIKLLNFKHSLSNKKSVIPEENKKAILFMEKMGFEKEGTLPRMLLGECLNWKPKLIYSRASGYCG